MKNKRLLFILLPATVLIWGVIVYRLAETLEGKSTSTPRNNASKDTKNSAAVKKDTLVLMVDYPDPFLRKKESGSGLLASSQYDIPKVGFQSTPAELITQWPSIEYLGLIQNGSRRSKVAIIRINGMEHFIQENERIDMLDVKMICRDSIRVTFQRETRFFRKTK